MIGDELYAHSKMKATNVKKSGRMAGFMMANDGNDGGSRRRRE
jgi:hypothetical protein